MWEKQGARGKEQGARGKEHIEAQRRSRPVWAAGGQGAILTDTLEAGSWQLLLKAES